MGEGHAIIPDAYVGSGVPALQVQRHFSIIFVGDLAEMLGGELAEVVMVDSTGTGQDHAWALVMRLDVLDKVVTGHAFDVGGGAEDGAAQGGALVGHGVEVVKDNLL